ncbi:MAG: helix-turn-helix transcriptional regulator [Alphaproteobacteria bacterium]
MTPSSMTGDDLREWRKLLGMTQWEAGEALGLSVRAIRKYEGLHGAAGVPRLIELACSGFLAQVAG